MTNYGTTVTVKYDKNQKLQIVFTVPYEAYSWYPCIPEDFEATHQARLRPSKGAESAQKALQGSETYIKELLGRT